MRSWIKKAVVVLAVAGMASVGLSMTSCATWRAREVEDAKGNVLVVTGDHAYELRSAQVHDGRVIGWAERGWTISKTGGEGEYLDSGDDSPGELAKVFGWRERELTHRGMSIDVAEVRHVRVRDPRTWMTVLAVLGVLSSIVVTVVGGAVVGSLALASCGRPLRVRGRRCLTPIAAREDWIATATIVPVTDPAARRALVEVWTEEAQAEHAAVAAFSKLSLELLALGAPPRLVTAANRAALQEVHHARLCFGLASAYSGERLGPGPLPQALEGDTADPVRIAREALLDGCLREGLAAEIARIGATTARDPVVARVLRVQAVEETQHAALGWSIVEWCLERGGEPMRRALRSAIGEARMPRCDDLPDHGRVSAQQVRPLFDAIVASARARLDALDTPTVLVIAPRRRDQHEATS